jgi:Tfp pilus assembly protein PilN
MKTVNLLPQWYRQQRRRQSHMRLHALVMMFIGGLMVGATFLGRRELAAMNQRRDALAVTFKAIPDSSAQLTQLKAELHRLEDLRLARQELGNTIPMSAVVQQLQNDMTRGMAFSNVTVDVRPEPIRGSGVVGDMKNPPRYHDVAHLSVVGIAPNDVQIARYIDCISRNPLFADVTLDYTRTGEQQRRVVRKFDIQLNMDLERLLSVAPDTVAAAPTAAGTLVSGEPTDGH